MSILAVSGQLIILIGVERYLL